jgi:hypothetical protein
MGVEEYLKEQASDGSLEAEGRQFTLDLARAADKLAAFALPSRSHYLLKIVQVAHHLRAEVVKVKIERFRTVVRFRAPEGGGITDSEAIYRAFADPLAIQDPVMVDFIAGLIGTITDDNLETLWSYSEGHLGRRVFINRKRRFSIEDFTLSQPLDADDHPYAFTLSILHPKTWKFWLGARRRASAARVLEENCCYSGVKIKIDSRELCLNTSSELNNHLAESNWSNDGYFQTKFPADNILYDMASPGEMRCCILRPSLSAYVVRSDFMNLWVSAIRVNNTLKPDGDSSAAWMLQFLEEGKNVSMRFAPKRVPIRACLVLNISGKGSDEPLRIIVVRAGITVLEQTMSEAADDLEKFSGCILLFHDEELETDLTGFQIIQNEAFLEKIRSFLPLLIKARQYYEIGTTMIQGHPESERM